MRNISLEELLEAGCHFGHQVTRQNPKARDFVFEAREGIHIIDLEKTKVGLEEAGIFIKAVASKGGTLILLGTKRQARGIVLAEFERARKEGASDGLFIVTQRWVGGILTNFDAVSKNFARLRDLQKRLVDEEEKAKFTKKEILLWDRERLKLESFYGGIADMTKTPDSLFIIDTHLEALAVSEATKTGATTVGIVDTNADPEAVNYPIPANDDAVGSIKLIADYIIDAWIEGKKKGKEEQKEAKLKEEVKEKKETEETKKTENKQTETKEANPKEVLKKKIRKKKTE